VRPLPRNESDTLVVLTVKSNFGILFVCRYDGYNYNDDFGYDDHENRYRRFLVVTPGFKGKPGRKSNVC
jgi:hypothetical protein